MYLIDTNVWLERLLDQERSEEVGTFLNTIPSNQLFITGFAFHSIALILTRLNQPDALRKFIQDIFTQGAVSLLHSNPSNIESMLKIIQNFELDFDDAYQYALAEHHNLVLVSFDHHFDRTTRGKKTPVQVVKSLEPDDTLPETEKPPSPAEN